MSPALEVKGSKTTVAPLVMVRYWVFLASRFLTCLDQTPWTVVGRAW